MKQTRDYRKYNVRLTSADWQRGPDRVINDNHVSGHPPVLLVGILVWCFYTVLCSCFPCYGIAFCYIILFICHLSLL